MWINEKHAALFWGLRPQAGLNPTHKKDRWSFLFPGKTPIMGVYGAHYVQKNKKEPTKIG
jgi:hypothetical protein